jgi:hypothetical protein
MLEQNCVECDQFFLATTFVLGRLRWQIGCEDSTVFTKVSRLGSDSIFPFQSGRWFPILLISGCTSTLRSFLV